MNDYKRYLMTISDACELSERHRQEIHEAEQAGRAALEDAMRTERTNRELLDSCRRDVESLRHSLDRLRAQAVDASPAPAPALPADVAALPQVAATLRSDIDSAERANEWVVRQRAKVADLQTRRVGIIPADTDLPPATTPPRTADTRPTGPKGRVVGVVIAAFLAVIILIVLVVLL